MRIWAIPTPTTSRCTTPPLSASTTTLTRRPLSPPLVPSPSHLFPYHKAAPSSGALGDVRFIHPLAGAVTNIPGIAGFTHKYNVQYIAKQLSVYIDDSASPAYQTTIDIPSIISLNSSGAFIGLTAACMSTCENVEVLNWSFNYVATLDATKSFVSNVMSSAVAGRTSSFTVQGVDTNGYFYQTYVTHPPPLPTTATRHTPIAHSVTT
jgi:hypothetical protein